MPPRAVGRRSARASSILSARSEVDDEALAQSTLEKPNLPRLKGTPSSRRQYTYGSGEEPLPSRPGQRLRQDQSLDLGNAVGSLLQRQEEEDETTMARMPPPPPPARILERDELAEETVTGTKNRGTQSLKEALDEVHASLPQVQPGLTPEYFSLLTQSNTNPQDDMSDIRSYLTESDFYGDATIISSPGTTPVQERQAQSRQRPRESNLRNIRESDPSEEDDELAMNAVMEPPAVPTGRKKLRALTGQGSRQSPRKSRRGNDINEQRDERADRAATPEIADRNPAASPEPRAQTTSRQGFTNNLPLLRAPSSRGLQLRSDHSEQDDAMQRLIHEGEEAATARLAPQTGAWEDGWIRIKNFSPFRQRTREEVPPDDLEEDSSVDLPPQEPLTSRYPFLKLSFYLKLILTLIDFINDQAAAVFSRIRSIPGLLGSAYVPRVEYLIVALILGLFAIYAPFPTRTDDMEFPPALFSAPLVPLLALKDAFRHIGDLVNNLPLPFRGRDDVSSLFDLGEDGLGEVADYLRKFDEQFKSLKTTGNLHGDSLKKLNSVVPKVVHMELKDGNPVISQEFWHAIRDLIKEEDDILTVDKKGRDSKLSSDRHWQMIAARLVTDPTFTSKLDMSLSDVENHLDKKMTSAWEGWVKENDEKSQKLQEGIGSANSTLVTKDQFLQHVRNEFAVHRTQIRDEMEQLRPRLETFVRESIDKAKFENTAPSGTLTREDVTTLVHGLMRKALADLNIEALAKGKIHAHWDLELKNQVNYFNPGSGAIINTKYSSKVYDPKGVGFVSQREYSRGLRGDYSKGLRGAKPLPPMAALVSWSEDGDCWCAAREVNHRGNPHGATLVIQLAKLVLPQQIVVEHILPGATMNPGARPRDIEVYAEIEDERVRELVRNFAATHFPDPDDWNAAAPNLPSQFVKIGQFVYEGAELHDGVYVHRLSSELESMGVLTDQVVIRAISNYGALEHTCFYRVRLFGKALDG